MSMIVGSRANTLIASKEIRLSNQRLGSSMEKIASGKRVNKSADDPTSMMLKEKLSNQMASLDQAIRNSEVDVSIMQLADSSLGELIDLLIRMRQIAVESANEAVGNEDRQRILQREHEVLLQSLDSIARDTKFGDRKLLDGSSATSGYATDPLVEIVRTSGRTSSTDENGYEVIIAQSATRSLWAADTAFDEDIAAEGVLLRIFENGRHASYTTTELDTPTSIASGLQESARRAGLDVTVDLDNDKLFVYHNKFGSQHTFQVSSSYDGVLGEDADEITQAIPGFDAAGTLGPYKLKGEGQLLYGPSGTELEGLVIRYRGFEEVWEGVEGDNQAGSLVLNNNSLKFQTGIDPGSYQAISLNAVNADKLGRGAHTASGFKSLKDIRLDDTQGARDAITLIDNAINEVSYSRGEIGAVQKYGLESNLSNLRVMKDNLVAAESTVADTNYAEEISKMMREMLLINAQASVAAQNNQSQMEVGKLLSM